MTRQIVPIVVLAIPALALVLWPLLRRRVPGERAGARPRDDSRLELAEEKAAILRSLNELAFDHEAGHLSDDDYQDLRPRYEARAAEVIRALDALPPVPAAADETDAEAGLGPGRIRARRGITRSPVTAALGAVVLLLFGLGLGLGIGRYTEPDLTTIPPGSRLPVPVSPGTEGGGAALLEAPAEGSGQPIAPEMLAGMLSAARQSLTDGRYTEAIAAYRAVLKRDGRNVDAMTHLGLIVAIGGHADAALETWDKALAIDSRYAPAHLYRGQVLYEVKQDYPAALSSWERFVALVPQGEDHDRVQALMKEVRAKQRGK
jgi:tetratricopeptide (TPR) repeat protein